MLLQRLDDSHGTGTLFLLRERHAHRFLVLFPLSRLRFLMNLLTHVHRLQRDIAFQAYVG